MLSLILSRDTYITNRNFVKFCYPHGSSEQNMTKKTFAKINRVKILLILANGVNSQYRCTIAFRYDLPSNRESLRPNFRSIKIRSVVLKKIRCLISFKKCVINKGLRFLQLNKNRDVSLAFILLYK